MKIWHKILWAFFAWILLAAAAEATVSTTTFSTTITGNGSTLTFNYSFLIPYQSDGITPAVQVYVCTPGVTSGCSLIPSNQYTITGVGNAGGGTVTYPIGVGPTPLPSTETITITRALNYVQPFAVNNYTFYPHTVEQAADSLELQIQQLVGLEQPGLLLAATSASNTFLPCATAGTNQIQQGCSPSQIAIAGGAALGTNTVNVGTGLTGGGALSTNPTLSIASTGVSAGVYGSNTLTPVITVNAQGQLTSATTITTASSAVATSSSVGTVKPDNTSLSISSGTLSAIFGSTTGTVAQGNDIRIVNAVQNTDPKYINACVTTGCTFTGSVSATAGLYALGTSLYQGAAMNVQNDCSAAEGTGYGACWTMYNSYSGALHPYKGFRITSGGDFQIVNSLFNTILFDLSDTGALAVVGTFTGDVSPSSVTPTGLATARTLAKRATDVLNAADYGVKCDNATDDTTALNTFFAALTGGKIGVINAGVCVFSNTLSMNLHGATLQGAGENATEFYYNGSSTTLDLIQINGAYSCSIGGFHIYSATRMTAGAAVHVMNGTGHCYLTGIDTGQQSEYPNYNLWNGFWVDESDGIFLTQFQDFVQNDGIDVSGQGVAHPPQYEFYATNGKIAGNANIGVHIGGGWDGAYFDTIMDTSNKTNVVIDHALQSYGNQEIIFGPRFTTDQAQTGDDYYINDSLAVRSNYCQITIMGPVTYSLTGNGIHVVSWPSCFVNVTSGWIDGHNQNGILIGDNTAVVNVSSAVNIENNGQYGISAAACCATVNSTATMAGNTVGTYNYSTVYTQKTSRTFLNVTAVGTTQGTAAILTADFNYVTAASSTYGVILPPTVGVETLVSNVTGTSFLVYPPSGSRIGANATNAGVVLAGAAFARFFCTTTTQCYVQ